MSTACYHCVSLCRPRLLDDEAETLRKGFEFEYLCPILSPLPLLMMRIASGGIT